MRPALIPVALLLALAAGGCSVGGTKSASSGSFTGVRGAVAVTINTFSSDANSNNAADICKNVLDPAALARLKPAGDCKTIITNQLKTINDFTLSIQNIVVNANTAIATVQTVRNGKKVVSALKLEHGSAGWRLDSITS